MEIQKLKIDADEHICFLIESNGRPSINLDIGRRAGRRYLSIRVNGMVTSSHLLDVEELPTMEYKNFARFCPYCGEEISLISSKSHRCKDER